MSKPLRLAPEDALFLGRCTYAGLLLLLCPIKSPRALAALGGNHFHPPLGPFALFDSYPSTGLILALEAAAFLLLALWVAGWGRWLVGLSLTLVLVAMSGFVYSAGKIDHDFVILLVPILLTLPHLSPKRAILFCLAVYFASSGLAKALGGWLAPDTQATLSWALLYFHAYGKSAFLLEWSLTTLPGWAWEIFDQITVWFELLVPLALISRFQRPVFLAVPLFHLGTILFFGIDFTRLLLVYLPLALLGLTTPDPAFPLIRPRTKRILIALYAAACLATFLHLWLRGSFWTLPFPVHPPGLLLFPLFEAALVIVMIHRHRASKPE